jgi:RNA polymerase-binding transcription factor DksA
MNLRVITVDAADLSQARKSGSLVLEELCEAKRLAPCVGLVECDILSPAQKRELLGARAMRLREEEGGGRSPLVDVSDPRRQELEALRSDLLEEYEEITQDNRRQSAEAAAAALRNPRPIPAGEQGELGVAAVATFLDDELRSLRTARLDSIERALDAMARGRFGDCARCGRPIDTERLREAPDTVVCEPCAREALPEVPTTD